MNKKQLKAILSGLLKKIRKYAIKIEAQFQDEDIHRLRVEIKKLRAFLRMIVKVNKKTGNVKLPAKLKKVYSVAGVIRDIHLNLQKTEGALKQNGSIAGAYVESMKEKAGKNRKKLAKLLSRDPLPGVEKALSDGLPPSLSLDEIHIFFEQKIALIRTGILKKNKKDEDLHSIRKNLKDLMYAAKILDQEIINPVHPPFVNATEMNAIERLAERLGMFNDIVSAIIFLKKDHEPDAVEKIHLDVISKQWFGEKEQLRQSALRALEDYYTVTPAPG